MILSSIDIAKALKNQSLTIDPLPEISSIDSSAVDLRIGGPFFVWNSSLVQQKGVDVTVNLDSFKYQSLADPYLSEVQKEANGQYTIEPNKFYLSATHERVHLPIKSRLAARVEGKSSLARLGLVIHMTAPTIHCGFDGVITLEIFNYGPFPLRVTPGKTRVCQLIIEKLSSVPKEPGGKSFSGQKTAKGK